MCLGVFTLVSQKFTYKSQCDPKKVGWLKTVAVVPSTEESGGGCPKRLYHRIIDPKYHAHNMSSRYQ